MDVLFKAKDHRKPLVICIVTKFVKEKFMTTASRAHARLQAVATATSRSTEKFRDPEAAKRVSEVFASNVFSHEQMKKSLGDEDLTILQEYAVSGTTLTSELADKVAQAAKEWALAKGATHYTHWFQPQTGSTAEKHDAFFDFDKDGVAIEKFRGKELIQQEPDASSFPSGGRRETFEARGYTIWDASSPMFLMDTENGKTLTIPSLFVSYSGEALDLKTPLLRSVRSVNKNATQALKLLGDETKYVEVNCGPEQEFFLIDEALAVLRPDLCLAQKTVLGKGPQKGQQLDDHYFGAIKPRVLNMIMEAELELIKLGIPIKTRHNEVAPAQFEMAPIYESANVAADHNHLVMDILKKVAKKHNLKAIFHEKPFDGLNGSGKHLNWSISTAEGVNLLSPGDTPHKNIRFLYFLAATLKALKDNGDLLRASVAVPPGNEFRMGANEAPPAIISAFLGDTLSEVVHKIATGATGDLKERAQTIDLEIAKVPVISKDNTDRNRTSPFAFTGNKFEFRALGSSQSISDPIVFLNAAVSQALAEMNTKLAELTTGTPSDAAALAVISEVFIGAKEIEFNGDGYGEEWEIEAKKRGLSNFKTAPEALNVLTSASSADLLTSLGIMSHAEELEARYNVFMDRYVKLRLIELETAAELLKTHVIPAATLHQMNLASSIETTNTVLGKTSETQVNELEALVKLNEDLITGTSALESAIAEAHSLGEGKEAGEFIATKGLACLATVRKTADTLEGIVDDSLWTLPKYRELLFVY